MGGEVHDGVRTAQCGLKPRAVANIALDQWEAAGEGTVPGGEIVIDDDLVPAPRQLAHRMATDVSRAPGDYDTHSMSLMPSRINRSAAILTGVPPSPWSETQVTAAQ